jgi:hypothetical protein
MMTKIKTEMESKHDGSQDRGQQQDVWNPSRYSRLQDGYASWKGDGFSRKDRGHGLGGKLKEMQSEA